MKTKKQARVPAGSLEWRSQRGRSGAPRSKIEIVGRQGSESDRHRSLSFSVDGGSTTVQRDAGNYRGGAELEGPEFHLESPAFKDLDETAKNEIRPGIKGLAALNMSERVGDWTIDSPYFFGDGKVKCQLEIILGGPTGKPIPQLVEDADKLRRDISDLAQEPFVLDFVNVLTRADESNRGVAEKKQGAAERYQQLRIEHARGSTALRLGGATGELAQPGAVAAHAVSSAGAPSAEEAGQAKGGEVKGGEQGGAASSGGAEDEQMEAWLRQLGGEGNTQPGIFGIRRILGVGIAEARKIKVALDDRESERMRTNVGAGSNKAAAGSKSSQRELQSGEVKLLPNQSWGTQITLGIPLEILPAMVEFMASKGHRTRYTFAEEPAKEPAVSTSTSASTSAEEGATASSEARRGETLKSLFENELKEPEQVSDVSGGQGSGAPGTSYHESALPGLEFILSRYAAAAARASAEEGPKHQMVVVNKNPIEAVAKEIAPGRGESAALCRAAAQYVRQQASGEKQWKWGSALLHVDDWATALADKGVDLLPLYERVYRHAQVGQLPELNRPEKDTERTRPAVVVEFRDLGGLTTQAVYDLIEKVKTKVDQLLRKAELE